VFRLVLSQNKKELLTNWYNEGKLESSEELGDLVGGQGPAGWQVHCGIQYPIHWRCYTPHTWGCGLLFDR
jgi:hypothetical protein